MNKKEVKVYFVFSKQNASIVEHDQRAAMSDL